MTSHILTAIGGMTVGVLAMGWFAAGVAEDRERQHRRTLAAALDHSNGAPMQSPWTKTTPRPPLPADRAHPWAVATTGPTGPEGAEPITVTIGDQTLDVGYVLPASSANDRLELLHLIAHAITTPVRVVTGRLDDDPPIC